MCMIKLSHLLAIVPVSVLLTASFFVLYALRKVEEKGLKAFGYVAAASLWLAALVVFSGAVYKMSQGPGRMPGMMGKKMGCMSQMISKPEPKGMPMPGKEPMAKDQKQPPMGKCSTDNKGYVVRAE